MQFNKITTLIYLFFTHTHKHTHTHMHAHTHTHFVYPYQLPNIIEKWSQHCIYTISCNESRFHKCYKIDRCQLRSALWRQISKSEIKGSYIYTLIINSLIINIHSTYPACELLFLIQVDYKFSICRNRRISEEHSFLLNTVDVMQR